MWRCKIDPYRLAVVFAVVALAVFVATFLAMQIAIGYLIVEIDACQRKVESNESCDRIIK